MYTFVALRFGILWTVYARWALDCAVGRARPTPCTNVNLRSFKIRHRSELDREPRVYHTHTHTQRIYRATFQARGPLIEATRADHSQH